MPGSGNVVLVVMFISLCVTGRVVDDLRRASSLEQHGQYREAVNLYKKAVAAMSPSEKTQYVDALVRAALLCHTKLSDRKTAVQLIRDAVAHVPGNAKLHLILGDLLVEGGETSQGYKHVLEAHRRDPGNRLAAFEALSVGQMVGEEPPQHAREVVLGGDGAFLRDMVGKAIHRGQGALAELLLEHTPSGSRGQYYQTEKLLRQGGRSTHSLVARAVQEGVWTHAEQRAGYLVPLPDPPDPFPTHPDVAHAVKVLEEAAGDIAAEWGLRTTTDVAVNAEVERLGGGGWEERALLQEGVRADCGVFEKAFPSTTRAVLAAAPTALPKGFAGFSLLRPGARIAPHCGPTNHRWRLHLGVDIPSGCAEGETAQCAIRVGGQTRQWKAGKVLVLDDSVEHEVWNLSDKPRVVLILDIWNPLLDEGQRRKVQEDFGFQKTVDLAHRLWRKHRCDDNMM